MNALLISALTLAAYLIGSIPFGLLIAKTKGLDIREQGSGNIGATNVLRCLGKPLGITCFVLDVLKGFLPAFLFPMIGTGSAGLHESFPSIGILFGAVAILGHNFPVFLKFKGGKGVATTAGVLIGIAPLAVALGLTTWAIVFYVSGYVSLGSIIASGVVILTGWVASYDLVTAIALTLLGSLSIYRHRANIQRLRNGTENKFERKKKS
jgi:glycerol-3-phosphate acyltransferase PlsY